MRIGVIVPVSPFESPEVVRKSIEYLKSLDYDDFKVRFVYVIDGERDEKVEVAEKLGVHVLHRKSRRGKRGGAINDAIEYLRKFRPKYIAIFDVDSRPEKNFVVECVKALENCSRCYIASSKRYVINGVNLVSETVEAEYYLINFLLSKSAFKQFNGLIGVLRADILMREKLNEDAVTEDADFATRMHARGLRAILVNTTKLYEEAPLTWRDLYSQRKRWYYGGLQLWRYKERVFRADRKFRSSWLSALTFTYLIALMLPALILAPPLLLYKFGKSKLKVFFGLIFHTLILQTAAFAAIASFLSGKGVEWGKIKRSLET